MGICAIIKYHNIMGAEDGSASYDLKEIISMAAKVCYNCGKKLHGNGINCTNCGAHQWREGTDRMSVEQLKEKADDEFRQAKLAKGDARDTFMEMAMFHYHLIAERINTNIPHLEDLEPIERCIHMLEIILNQEWRAESHGNEIWQQGYKDMLERLNNKKENIVYDRMEKRREAEGKKEPAAAAAPQAAENAAPGAAPAALPASNGPDKLDELVDYAIFTVSEMDEMGSWNFLGKPRSKNYMISMFSFLRDIKDQLSTLEEKEREVLLHVMFQVADSYEKGTYPFPQDPSRAVDWHVEAANRGLVLSYLAIGDIYMKGSGGLRPQLEKALEWFEKALASSNSPKITEYAEAAIEHIKYTMRTMA